MRISKFFRNKETYSFFRLDIVILILWGTAWGIAGSYYMASYALLIIIVLVMETRNKTLNRIVTVCKSDKTIIHKHFIESFKVWYYLIRSVWGVAICCWICFFYVFSKETAASYSLVLTSITYLFIIACLVNLGIETFIIFFKNDPVSSPFLSLILSYSWTGIRIYGAATIFAYSPVTPPNDFTNGYHLNAPTGRGYAAHSMKQLWYLDELKTHLQHNFDINKCIDNRRFLDTQKIISYGAENGLDVRRLVVAHDVKVDGSFTVTGSNELSPETKKQLDALYGKPNFHDDQVKKVQEQFDSMAEKMNSPDVKPTEPGSVTDIQPRKPN